MPITTDIEKLRLTIGDNDATAQLFTDDELQYFLDLNNDNILKAGADASDAAAAKFARSYNFETDGQRFDREALFTHYQKLASTLRARGTGLVIGPDGKILFGVVATIDSTRIDGFSEDIPNQEVGVTSDEINPRQRFYTVDGMDKLP